MEELLEELKKLNLKAASDEYIKSLIIRIGEIPIMRSEYHEGKIIYRARNNDNDDFTEVSDLSFKPQERNKTFQRASTPFKTMFYGGIVPQEIEIDGEIEDERITTAFETVDFLRDLSVETGQQVLTYGVWRVKSTISTLSILYSNPDDHKIGWQRKLGLWFNNSISEMPNSKGTIEGLQDYLAFQFSKEVKKGEDYYYKVSAYFAERACEMGVDGILYPSVKTGCTGLNIALRPEVVNEKLELISVLKSKVYKNGDRVIINNLKKAYLEKGDEQFKLEEIELGKYRDSEANILRRLRLIQS
jgi:hypothetical protein